MEIPYKAGFARDSTKNNLLKIVIFMWKQKGQAVENRKVVHICGSFVESFGKPCGNLF